MTKEAIQSYEDAAMRLKDSIGDHIRTWSYDKGDYFFRDLLAKSLNIDNWETLIYLLESGQLGSLTPLKKLNKEHHQLVSEPSRDLEKLSHFFRNGHADFTKKDWNESGQKQLAGSYYEWLLTKLRERGDMLPWEWHKNEGITMMKKWQFKMEYQFSGIFPSKYPTGQLKRKRVNYKGWCVAKDGVAITQDFPTEMKAAKAFQHLDSDKKSFRFWETLGVHPY